uniref:Uncharacterized protein n=1 Tax=Arundo donax TaxID=35708 RepID=A0A0A9H0S8_ARUDO
MCAKAQLRLDIYFNSNRPKRIPEKTGQRNKIAIDLSTCT